VHAANAAALVTAVQEPSGNGEILNADEYRMRFLAAIDNDLDTPTALVVLYELADEILGAAGMDIRPAQNTLKELADILGLVLAA
jgi:cysteinyl-tRNA synthetase